MHDAATAVDFFDFDGVHVIERLNAALFKLQEAKIGRFKWEFCAVV